MNLFARTVTTDYFSFRLNSFVTVPNLPIHRLDSERSRVGAAPQIEESLGSEGRGCKIDLVSPLGLISIKAHNTAWQIDANGRFNLRPMGLRHHSLRSLYSEEGLTGDRVRSKGGISIVRTPRCRYAFGCLCHPDPCGYFGLHVEDSR